ncbi:diguanylate cyclase (GGDEF) domain-containing protein [Colwellia chukchiensis]|uniref:diguanylate cyclase n=1 Tax=Colwellia chukchiensis TaxID=641665 RepID=A0A1H7GAC0_9GAMM|nr:GGDEF domain-containing protein [Colwellia chukchiensis]SEK34994.1 diguanylate cyclase (GGDEF) domain-containing protein [Colwellia chukchiensis]
MSFSFSALKNNLVSLTLLVITLIAFQHYQSLWLLKLELIEQLLYGLFSITILLTSYFNRSRLAIAALLFFTYYLALVKPLPWQAWLQLHPQWLVLTGAIALSTLALLQDRALLSIHGFYRILLLIGLGGLSYLWLQQTEHISLWFAATPWLAPWQEHLAVELPLLLASIMIFWRSLSQQSLVTAALMFSYCLWLGQYYQLIQLPWSLLLTLLLTYYVAVVLIDSYFLAYRDELTGLPSRRALNQYALSLGRKYSLAMLDIDHFKKFNDSYGHDIGDQVLKLVASKLAQVNGGGKVFRYGGEEFTIVFARKTAEQALPALEAVRQTVADYKMVIRQAQRSNKKARTGKKNSTMKTVSVTISIGVAERGAKQSFEQSLKVADQALYRAKKAGRNQVCR